MTNPTTRCTDALHRALCPIRKGGVKDAAALMALPELHQTLMQAVRQWCLHVACRTHDAGMIGMDDEQLTNAILALIFSPREHGGYPSLDKLVTLAREDDAGLAERFLQSSAHYYYGLLCVRFHRRMERLRTVYSLVPGAAAPDKRKAWEDTPADTEAMLAVLAGLGQDPAHFIGDVVTLSDALRYERSKVCDRLAGGEQAALVRSLTHHLTYFLGCNATAALSALLEQAERFVLPEAFAADTDALRSFILDQPTDPPYIRIAARNCSEAP